MKIAIGINNSSNQIIEDLRNSQLFATYVMEAEDGIVKESFQLMDKPHNGLYSFLKKYGVQILVVKDLEDQDLLSIIEEGIYVITGVSGNVYDIAKQVSERYLDMSRTYEIVEKGCCNIKNNQCGCNCITNS